MIWRKEATQHSRNLDRISIKKNPVQMQNIVWHTICMSNLIIIHLGQNLLDKLFSFLLLSTLSLYISRFLFRKKSFDDDALQRIYQTKDRIQHVTLPYCNGRNQIPCYPSTLEVFKRAQSCLNLENNFYLLPIE